MITYRQFKRSPAGVALPLGVTLAAAGHVLGQMSFGDPENLGPTVNTVYHENGPSISADGLTLFFDSPRPGGFGSADLWDTTRVSTTDPWKLPVNLGPTVNTSAGEWNPSSSADGLTLYFASNRPGGSGSGDLWATTRISIAHPWQTPVNLGPPVNTSSAEWGPNIAADGLTLFFHSVRPGGFGGHDLWTTTRASVADPWQVPVNLGPTVNSSSDDMDRQSLRTG